MEVTMLVRKTQVLVESESTPLRELILKIPVRYWSMFKGIRLNRKLGFKTAMICPNLHHLMRYIGWNQKVAKDDRLAYQLYIDRDIQVISLEDLISCCEISPNGQFLEKIKEKMEINDTYAKVDSACRTRVGM